MTATRSGAGWLEALRDPKRRPPREPGDARRREEIEAVLAFRDSLPSIAPDTIAEYIRQIREEGALC